MADEQQQPQQPRSGLGGIGEGIRTGIGILSAFTEAVEETFREAVSRGDLTPERARRAMQDMGQRLQTGVEGARERMEGVSRSELADLRAELDALRARVAALEGAAAPAAAVAGTGGAEQTTPSGIIVTE